MTHHGRDLFGGTGLAILLAILLLTFGLRFHNLDTSLGADAFTTLIEANRTNLQTLTNYLTLRNAWDFDSIGASRLANDLELAMPGHFILVKLWGALVDSPTYAHHRLLSALMSGLVSVVLVIQVWRSLGRSAAIGVAVLVCFSPLLQYYGAYVRFYAALILASGIAYASSMSLLHELETQPTRANPWRAFFCPLLCWLVPFIHITGILIVFVALYPLIVFGVRCMSPRQRMFFAAGLVLPAIPVLVNCAAFIFARSISPSYMGTSVVAFGGSLFFNFNGVLFLILATYVCVGAVSRADLARWYGPFAFCFLCLFAASTLRPSLFRSDYVASLLAPTYFLFVHAVWKRGQRLLVAPISSNSAKQPWISLPALLVLVSITFTLPTFVSNAFIDQDRWDYQQALEDVLAMSGDGPVAVYARAPSNFPQSPSKRLLVRHLKTRAQADNDVSTEVFYLLRLSRHGFTKGSFDLPPDELAELTEKSTLMGVSGRPRLDLRDNLLLILRKRENP